MGRSRSCWNGRTSALQPEITSKGTRVSCVYYQYKCPYEKSLEFFIMILVYIYYKKELLYICIYIYKLMYIIYDIDVMTEYISYIVHICGI